MAKQIVTISNLSKSFGIKRILDNVSLNISDGDRIGLVGENGCGKTTFCKILLGKELSDSGDVAIASDVEIGYLPQDMSLHRHKSERNVGTSSAGSRNRCRFSFRILIYRNLRI